METDEEFKLIIEKLRADILGFYEGKVTDDTIQESSRVLTLVLAYAHKIKNERSVQIDQIENNIQDIRVALNQQPIKGGFSLVSHKLDNLIQYCGYKI